MSEGTGLQVSPCCTKDDTCGVRIPLSATCLPRNQFGTTNPDCVDYVQENVITLPGCCGKDGCGARATFENLGCISNQNLAAAEPRVRQNAELTPLVRTVPVDVDLDDLVMGGWDMEEVRRLFTFLEFRTLWDRLLEAVGDGEKGAAPSDTPGIASRRAGSGSGSSMRWRS